MTPHARLTVFHWMACKQAEISRAGLDPEDRVHYTGHRRHLLPRWLESLGLWCVLGGDELMNHREPHRGRLRCSSTAYWSFKSRNGLWTREEFEVVHGPEPWRLAEVCWEAHRRAQQAFEARNEARSTLGMACRAHVGSGQKPGASPLLQIGVLPVECAVWTIIFDDFLRRMPDVELWEILDGNEKLKLWTHCFPHDPRGTAAFARVLHSPAQRELRAAPQRHDIPRAVGAPRSGA